MVILQVSKTVQRQIYITHQAQANEERSYPHRKYQGKHQLYHGEDQQTGKTSRLIL